MVTDSDDAGTVVELYVRSLASPGSCDVIDSVIDRLERLEETGRIGTYTVEVWGEGLTIPTAERTETGKRILDRFSEFTTWAERTDHTLECFDRRTVRSELTGETYRRIEVPTMALAEYENEKLRHLAPCRSGESVVSVHDRLEALETNDRTDAKTPPRDPVDRRQTTSRVRQQ